MAALLVASVYWASRAEAAALPVVHVDTAGPIVDDPKVDGTMRIVAGGRTRFSGRIGIEVRGQASQRFPKKQFDLELRDAQGDGRDTGLLGLPEDDDWILYAAYNDGSLLRNVVAYRTARELGRYASRHRFVEVVLNGAYWGVYVLQEDRELGGDRVPRPEGSDGFLLEYTHPSKLDRGDAFFRTPVTRTPIVYSDPERGDMTRARAREIARRVGAFERDLYRPGYRHPTQGYRRHLDLPAAVDYALLYELFRNHDAFAASTFIHEGPGGTLAMGPLWDFDLSMGNPADLLPPRGCSLCDRRWAGRWYDDRTFTRAMTARWAQLRRQGLLRAIRADIARDARALAGPQVRNLRRWPVLGFAPVSAGASDAALRAAYRAEVGRLQRWIRVRAGWLTANLPRIGRL
jgi:CotH kinase protein